MMVDSNDPEFVIVARYAGRHRSFQAAGDVVFSASRIWGATFSCAILGLDPKFANLDLFRIYKEFSLEVKHSHTTQIMTRGLHLKNPSQFASIGFIRRACGKEQNQYLHLGSCLWI